MKRENVKSLGPTPGSSSNSVPINSCIHSFVVSNLMALISLPEINLECALHRIAR